MDLFAADGVLNGIGDVIAQQSFQGTQLSGLIVYLADFLPDIHRALKKSTVSAVPTGLPRGGPGSCRGVLHSRLGLFRISRGVPAPDARRVPARSKGSRH
jgi:hypothetical protein